MGWHGTDGRRLQTHTNSDLPAAIRSVSTRPGYSKCLNSVWKLIRGFGYEWDKDADVGGTVTAEDILQAHRVHSEVWFPMTARAVRESFGIRKEVNHLFHMVSVASYGTDVSRPIHSLTCILPSVPSHPDHQRKSAYMKRSKGYSRQTRRSGWTHSRWPSRAIGLGNPMQLVAIPPNGTTAAKSRFV